MKKDRQIKEITDDEYIKTIDECKGISKDVCAKFGLTKDQFRHRLDKLPHIRKYLREVKHNNNVKKYFDYTADISEEEYIKAIQDSDGTVRDIAYRVGLNPKTLQGRLTHHLPHLKKYVEQRRAEVKEVACRDITDEEYFKTIAESDGTLVDIARRLGINYKSFVNRVNKRPDLKEDIKVRRLNYTETVLSKARHKLITRMESSDDSLSIKIALFIVEKYGGIDKFGEPAPTNDKNSDEMSLTQTVQNLCRNGHKFNKEKSDITV